MSQKPLTICKASAGSGKTFTLALEYIYMMFEYVYKNNELLHPQTNNKQSRNIHRQILAVTFTNKATNEMKSRIVKQLYLLAQNIDSPYREKIRQHINDIAKPTIILQNTPKDYMLINQWCQIFLNDLLDDYGLFSVSTIDSFFQKIIRNFARELNLPGGYSIDMDEKQIQTMAVDNLLYSINDNETLKSWLQQMIFDNIENGKNWKIQNRLLKMSEQLFDEKLRIQMLQPEVKKFFNNSKQAKEIIEKIYNEKTDKIKEIHKKLQNILAQYGLSEDDIKSKWNELPQRDAPLTNTFINSAYNISACFKAQVLKNNENRCIDAYDNGVKQCHQEAIHIFSRYLTAKYILQEIYIIGILNDIDQQIQADNRQLNRLPMADTNRRLNQIINDNDIPFIYEKISQRIKHYLIDEFQDTSRLQWENFRPLVKENIDNGNRSLIVGDVKQSIYRWRNGDADLLANEIETTFPNQIQLDSLDTNYRSSAQIVEWNNSYFKSLINTINETNEKNDIIKKITIADKYYNNTEGDFKKAILKYYDETISQKVNPNNNYSGLIRTTFITPQDIKYDDILQQQLIKLINELKERQFNLNRVAILVRKNDEGKKIASILAENGIKVVSNESLTLGNAISIQLIINIFHHSEHPKEKIFIYNAYFWLATLLQQDYNWCIRQTNLYQQLQKEDQKQELSNTPLGQAISLIGNAATLYQKTEILINWLTQGCRITESNLTESETDYLQALLDNIHNFAANKSTDMYAFLQWWDLQKDKLAIPAPQQDNAIQISTIHKSKGLEFDVVIIPYCNWSICGSTNFLWVIPEEQNMDEDFKSFPILPIHVENKNNEITHTQCAQAYYDELLHGILDTLNNTYVAFTRPRHELYVFSQIKDDKDKKEITTIAQTLYKYISTQTERTGTEEGIETFQLQQQQGKDDWINKPAGNNQEASITIPDILKSNNDTHHITIQEIQSEETRRGTLMHNIMSEIKYADDIDKALAKTCTGTDKLQINTIKQQILEIINIPEVKPWFQPGHLVLNEIEILTPKGDTFRPDRVMLYPDGTIIVIDYKFTRHKSQSYNRQVQRYIELLNKAIPNYDFNGTRVDTKQIIGYLLYTDSKQIEKI